MAAHYVTWKVDGKLCRFDGSKDEVREVRRFMLRVSPLRRDEISEVMPANTNQEKTDGTH